MTTSQRFGTERQSRDHLHDRIEQASTHEGKLTRKAERVASAFPSGVWIALAGASIVGSLVLKLTSRNTNAIFVGQWAPMFMLIGVYNKIVKVVGSERLHRAGAA